MENSRVKNILCLTISTTLISILILSMQIPSKSSVSLMMKLRLKWTLSNGSTSAEMISERKDKISSMETKKEGIEGEMSQKFHSNRTENNENCLQKLQLSSRDNGTAWMNDVAFEGRINSSRNYALFSVTTDNNSQDYMFYLPLTTLAWKRIGFDSVILVVGSSNNSFSDPLIRYVLSRCRGLDAVILYIYSPIENAVTISQVGRLFAANTLSAAFADVDLVYLVTSDADLWPIHPDIYRLRSDMAMLSLNSDCCPPFTHHGLQYKMLPMSNIGMRVITWNRITEQDSIQPKSTLEILKFICREFGQVALQPVVKGENIGWYLDQMTISILMTRWTERYGNHRVMFMPRSTAKDRIDRSNWIGESSLEGKIDAHMPMKAFSPGVWKGITPLLKSMYGDGSERYNWSLKYFEGYKIHTRTSNEA